MRTFLGHANMEDPKLKGMLMDWSQHWEKGGVMGHVMCDDTKAVKAMTDMFGAKFEFHEWPADSGCTAIENGEKDKITNMEINYFAIHGRSETMELMTNFYGLDYKRSTALGDSWPAGADKLEMRGLPQVTFWGKQRGQAKATLRALGMYKGNYDTTDPMACYICDCILEGLDSIMGTAGGILLGSAPDIEAAKAAFKPQMYEFLMPIEQMMVAKGVTMTNGTNRLNPGDFAILMLYVTYLRPGNPYGFDREEIDKMFPHIAGMCNRMASFIPEYLAGRKMMM